MQPKHDSDTLEQAVTRAYLAAHAYRKYEDHLPLPSAWQRVATARDLIGETKSSFEGAVYSNGEKYVIAFCGFADAGDILPVIEAGFTGVPRQLGDALSFVLAARDRFDIPAADFEIVGHSLGGYLARAVGVHVGAEKVWAFNSPGFKKDDADAIASFCAGKADNVRCTTQIIVINSKYDLVAKWGYHEGMIIEIETAGNHHNMKVMIESMAQMCFISDAPEAESKLWLAARAFFDRIGKSEKIRTTLDRRFRGGI